MSSKKRTPKKLGSVGRPVTARKFSEGIFIGRLHLVDESRKGNEHTPLREEYVYLHPDVMTACGFVINHLVWLIIPLESSSVELKGDSEMYIAVKTWPLTKMGENGIGLIESVYSCYNLTDEVSVKVTSFSSKVQDASEVHINPCSEVTFPLDSTFKSYFQRVHDGRILLPDNVVSLQYFGKQAFFKIEKMVPFDHATGQPIKTECAVTSLDFSDVIEIDAKMDNLSVHDVDDEEQSNSLVSDSLVSIRSASSTVDNIPVVCQLKIRTNIVLHSDDRDSLAAKKHRVAFKEIAGCETVVTLLKQLVKLPLEDPKSFSKKGIDLPRAILLCGPPGSGKSMLGFALCNEVNRPSIILNSLILMESSLTEEISEKLKRLLREAKECAPSLIFVDDLYQMCPHGELGPSEAEKKVTASLCSFLDSLAFQSSDKPVVVIATTSSPEQVDPSLRRAGRFDKEIEISVPSVESKLKMLEVFTEKFQHNLTESEIQSLAEIAHGYVGADLKALCREAQYAALEECLSGASSNDPGLVSLDPYCVTYEHFKTAFHKVRPTAMREVQVEVPKVHWSDIGGLEDIKSKLKESVEWPLKHPEAFKRLGISPPKGILLYGPPGCSKTMIARAVATESSLNFLAVKGPELFSKYVGDSERAVRKIFQRARAAAPSIIFFDEIDALAAHRKSEGASVGDRVLAQLLTEMDGVECLQDVLIVAATNRPDMIDKAIIRPGRIDRIIYVPLPDLATRREILKIQFEKTPVTSEVSIEDLVSRTSGYSGAEIVSLCQEAALIALHEDIHALEILPDHFQKALEVVKPQTTPSTVQYYENYNKGMHKSNFTLLFGQ